MEQLVTTPDNLAPARSRTPHQLLPSVEQPATGAPRRNRRMRRTLAVTALFAAGALTLSACGGDASAGGNDDGKNGQAGADAAAAKNASDVKIKVSSDDGATNASINDTGVKATGGKLTEVKLTEADSGKDV
ncbi:hypothetical protein ACIPXV_34765, partial [Streptomyces libani]